MTKKLLITLGIAALIAVAIFKITPLILHSAQTWKAEKPSRAIPRFIKPTGAQPSWAQTLREPIHATQAPPSAPEPEAALSPEEACQRETQKLAETSLDDILKMVTDGSLKIQGSCHEGKIPAPVLQGLALCPQEMGLCQLNVVFLRAILIDRLHSQDTDYARMSDMLLINKYISNMSSANGSSGAQNMEDIAVEMIARRPGDPKSYKAYFMAAAMNSAEDFQEGAVDALDPLLKDVRQEWPEDRDFQELQALRLANQKDQAGLETMIASHPDSPSPHYWLAQTLWKSGDIEGATAHLQAALALAPQDSRLQETLNQLATAQPGDRIFSLQMGISFDDL